MNHLVQVDVTALTFVSGVVLPLIVGAVTDIEAPSNIKAMVNLLLSFAAGCFSYAIAHDGTLNVFEMLTAVGTTFISSGSSYNHLWKPTKVAQVVQEKTAGFGIKG